MINLTDYTMRCGISRECRHSLCEGTCGRPLRKLGHAPAEHPWTIVEYTSSGMCATCYNQMMKLRPEDLQDQRHHIMSDQELAHVLKTSKHMFVWHMYRRRRLGLTTAA